MNVANIEASLTTLINNAVVSSDLSAAPKNVPETVRNLSALLAAAEAHAVQFAKDVSRANSIATNLRYGTPIS